MDINQFNLIYRAISAIYKIPLYIIVIIYVIYIIIIRKNELLNILQYLKQFNTKKIKEKEDEQKKEKTPLYIKNILNEEIGELKFKTLFKFGHDPELKPAIQRLFEDNNKPVDISYSRIKKFNAYLNFKKNNNVYEVELKTCQFILYAFPILILSWFLIFFSAILYEAYIIYNFYSKLYAEKLNLSQILPYYQQNVNQGYEIIGILLAIIAIASMLIVFRIDSFFNLRKLKIALNEYYKKSENETNKFKRNFIWIISGSIIILIIFTYFTLTTKNGKSNPNISNKRTAPEQIPNESKAKYLSFKNRLGVKYYLGSKGFLKEYKKAITLWKEAANKGYPYSELNLGYMYASDISIKRNFSKASFWIARAFHNRYANQSIRALARKVWNQYKLWKYYKD